MISAAVHVQNEHHGSEPIADQPVTFTITGGGGTLVASDETEVRTLTVPTNGTGDATVSWRLGAGTNTLEASTAHVTNSPRVITATGVALPGYEVLSSNVVAVPANGGFATQTVQCSAGKVVLGGGAQVVGEGSGDFETRLQESAPGTIGGGARSLWLAPQKKWTRKLAEAAITLRLEEKLSKQEIFTYYCNQVYLGRSGTFSLHGFGAAAAGQTAGIWIATKNSAGVWSAFTHLTGRVIDSSGNAYFSWRYSTSKWISIKGIAGTVGTPGRQARWL